MSVKLELSTPSRPPNCPAGAGAVPKMAAVSLRLCSAVTANHSPENVARSSLSATLMEKEGKNGGCVWEDGNDEWRRETEVYKPSLSLRLIYTLICLSFSIHPHTVFPSFFPPDSPAECCIIPSVRGGRTGWREGWRWGRGERAMEREAAGRMTHDATSTHSTEPQRSSP